MHKHPVPIAPFPLPGLPDRRQYAAGEDGGHVRAAGGQLRPRLIRYVASAAMALRYKPAVCHGQPCEMLYPFAMEITHRLR